MSPVNALLLDALVPVFFGLVLGYYAGLRRLVDNRNVTALNVTLMHFVLPCSLFLGMGRASLSALDSQLWLLAILLVAMLATYLFVFLLERRLLRKSSAEACVQALTVGFANNVAVGIPLLVSLYGPTGLLSVTMAILVGVLVLSPMTLVMLEYSISGTAADAKPLWQRIGHALWLSLRRPVIVAPVCGLIFVLSGHALPVLAVDTLDLVGKGTVGLALFLTGLILSAHPIRLSAGVVWGVLTKNVGQPAIVFLLVLLLHQHGEVARGAFLLAALPAGFFGTVFGARFGVSSRDTSSTLVLSTLLSILTLPIAVALSGYMQ